MVKKGIKIYLTEDAIIPPWINQWFSVGRRIINYQFTRLFLNGKRIKCLTIVGGDYHIGIHNGGHIKFLRTNYKAAGFNPSHMLEVHNIEGGLKQRNWFMCTKCVAVTGEVQEVRPNRAKQDVDFRCQSCEHNWTWQLIDVGDIKSLKDGELVFTS